MIKVVGVKFKKAGKMYYFSPDQLEIKQGDNVIVETARGLEYGEVVVGIKEIGSDDIIQPLKKVIRLATGEDAIQQRANMEKKEKAIEQCQAKIDKHGLNMKLIDVEYTFDNSKVIFYFTADGRVDFRELVKDLASVFRMRIELRQIGVRDEAKMMGGIGSCGKGLCCNTWLPDFEPVSIKMAKIQNLSLNPTKISGICGRLMCCLKYENSTYCNLRKGMPEIGEKVKTPEGMAIVVQKNLFEESVKVRLIMEPAKGDKPEKLSEDTPIFKKQAITRIERRRDELDDDDEIPQEIAELVKD